MKILVLQLARFGDIYLTWPSLRALRRKYPSAEIHLLVRERFREATVGLGGDIVVHVLPTADLLRPILDPETHDVGRLKLDAWIGGLASTDWDQVINFSFSPSSSYLVDIVAGLKTEVRGYCRQPDGYLAIPDDASAYFYAQVGPDRFNRFHLVDIFAMVAQVDLLPSDWGYDGNRESVAEPSPAVLFHLGASQSSKCYPAENWRAVIERLSATGLAIGLIGSKDEADLADELVKFPNVVNLIGHTTLAQLFTYVAKARLIVGADSAPVHVAAHVGTPVLNLSFSSVSFWETGPVSTGSRVLVGLTPGSLEPGRVVEGIHDILNGTNASGAILTTSGSSGPRFETEEISFSWRLILALYTQSDYPPLPNDRVLILALQRLEEVTELALEQLGQMQKTPRATAPAELLSSVDLVLKEVPRLAPAIAPLVSWFETERLRIPPGGFEHTLKITRNLFQDFKTILSVFSSSREPNFDSLKLAGIERIAEIERELPDCARSFRMMQTSSAEPMLQRLLGHLTFFEENGLHHLDPTKVEGDDKAEIGVAWNRAYDEYHEILRQLIAAFEKRDYVYVADLLEYEIANCLTEWRAQLVKWRDAMLT